MKKSQELYNALKNIAGKNATLVPAIVKEVNGDDTLNVEIDELMIYDVRVKAVIVDSLKGLNVKPAVDSVVLLQRIGDDNEYCVCMYSEVDEVKTEIGATVYQQKASGFKIEKGADSVKQILTDIVDACLPIVVAIGNGPDYAKLTATKVKIENLFD
jgi:hypothetical protein